MGKALSPWLSSDVHILELSAGKSAMGVRLMDDSRVAAVLSTDISPEIVNWLQLRYRQEWSRLEFAVADNLNLKLNTKPFQIVIEQAGCFDFYQKNGAILERMLECITT